MSELDIKLLQVFAEIFATGSVSNAAARLGLTQPTLSFALAKLRERYDDPLFVRVGQRMQPTAFATELQRDVTELLDAFQGVASRRKAFQPSNAEMVFRIAMTDISQIVMLPRLVAHLNLVAPHVRLEILHITDDTLRLLESGRADLAVGFMPDMHAGFYHQKLFSQDYVGLVAAQHPRLASGPSIEAFLSEGHIRVAAAGTGHADLDEIMKGESVQRKSVLELPDYLGLGNLVARTDLVATVPRLLARHVVQSGALRCFELPFRIPGYQVKQHWHERAHADLAQRWMRGLFVTLFLEREPSAEENAAAPG